MRFTGEVFQVLTIQSGASPTSRKFTVNFRDNNTEAGIQVNSQTAITDVVRTATARPSGVLNLALSGWILLLNVSLFGLSQSGRALDWLGTAALTGPDEGGARFAAWALATLLLMLFAPMHWGLLHEGFHRQLNPNRRVNDVLGRGLAVLYAAPYSILRFGHLFHHRHNRTELDRSEHYAPSARGFRARINYFFRLFGGLYLVEVLFGLLVFLPVGLLRRGTWRLCGSAPEGLEPLAAQIERELLSPAALRTLRIEGLLQIVWLGALWMTLGPMFFFVLVSLAARGMVVSLLDNAFHYGGPLDDLRSAFNARLPGWAALLVLNSNYHGVHHHYPRVPWRHLPRVFSAQRNVEGRGKPDVAVFDGAYLNLVARQLNGPIFDARQ